MDIDTIPFINQLSRFDLIVFWINLLILLTSRWIIKGFRSETDQNNVETKLWTLRAINLILLGLYVLALVENIESTYAGRISLSGLTLLLAFLAVHFFQLFLLRKFGRVREIEGEEYRSETYQSEVFGLLAVIVASIVTFLVVINIWEITNWLQATSVLGGLLILLYSTKDVWASDNINGLILLYNGDIEPGSLVKIDDYGLLAIALQTTLTQTAFRDLRLHHRIVIPNSKLRDVRVDVLSKVPNAGLRQFVEFKIGYGIAGQRVENFLLQVWERALALDKGINDEREPVITLVETGDHGVTWRLSYSLKNVYRLIDAECAIKRVAYDLSLETGIGLATPLTHTVSLLGFEAEKPVAIRS